MEEKICNVFISHIHEDDRKIRDLKNLLASQGCTARDSSINSSNPNEASNPDYIKQEILAPQISWAGTLVVLISPHTHESPWVNWEIEYAKKLDKRIIGVWDEGATDCDVPEALDDYGDAVVDWNADRVVDAIFGRINNWHLSNGAIRPAREIARHGC